MKRSYLVAAGLTLAAIIWVGSGQLDGGADRVTGQKPPADLDAAKIVPAVRVRTQSAEPHTMEIFPRGRTEAIRKVDVKAETHGRIVELTVEKGDRVEDGALLARLSDEDRPARLAEAKALREQRRIEYEAARKLSEKGFRAETQLAAAHAAYQAASAAVVAAEVEVANTAVLAPFKGIISRRAVEIGDFVEKGEPIVRVIDLDPLLIVVQLNERDAAQVQVGKVGYARLITGQEIEGRVRYVAPEADQATRTFRVELEAANPTGTLADGVTTDLRLPLRTVIAHRISPAILTLGDNGDVGVKTVGPDNRVGFAAVRIVAETATAAWVTGLPPRATLITVGQEYVVPGQTVRPIDEATLAPARGGGSADPAKAPEVAAGEAT
ncbi:MAG: efflux RND transporter periplasmic adaptor subunit [Kiloniellaceae bacterium]